MTRSTKRLLALLLALILCVSLLPAAALAEEEGEEAGTIAPVREPEGDGPLDVPEDDPDVPLDEADAPETPESLPPAEGTQAATSGQCGDDLTWHFDTETGVLTVTGTGAMWDWTDGGTPWNSIRSSITAAELPDGLTSIGNDAFWECTSLTSVTIPASVTAIGEYAFYGAGLTELTIPGSVETIGRWAFAQNRSLERVTLQEGISSIGIWAFCYCSHLREIRIPASTAALGGNALRSDPALTEVYYGGTRSQWAQIAPDYLDRYQVTVHCSDGDVETLDRVFCGDDLTWTLENGVLTVSGTGNMWDYYEKVWGLGMSIGGESTAPWSTCLNEITGVVIEPGVTSVGACAFSGCRNLSSISMPDGLTRIGNGAFQGCTSLQSVTIPQGVEVLGPAAFYFCQKLSQVTLPSGLREIGGEVSGGAFQWCTSLREITIPDSVTVVGNRAFYGCSSLETVCLPTALTSIGWDGFFDCSGLHTIIFQGGAPSIRTDAFSGVTATAYYPAEDETWTDDVRQSYGGTLTWVALIASGQCGDRLTWVLTDDGVLTITGTGDMWDWLPEQAPWYDFHDSITSVSLPEGLTCIGNRAFWGCGSLSSVTIPYGVTHIGSHAFRMCSSLASVEIPASVTRIDEYVFYDCGKLTTAGPLDGDYRIRFGWADSIPDGAFYNCNHLTSITFPEGTTSIGKYAFWSCINLKSVEIPESVSEIGAMAFYKCTSLSSITIPGNVASIGDFAFQECKGLKSLVIEEGVTDLGLGTFNSCTALERVTLPDSLVSIGNSVFYYCKSLNNVTIPSHVISIEDYAFNCCISLTDITIPEGVTRLGDCAFSLCKNMTRIVFLGGAPGMGSNCFYDVTATAYYPADDSSWTEAVRQDYGGTLTWVPYTGEPVINVFTDVQYGKYYYEPVLWAYYHDPQITGGISETEFGPGNTCTREQIVTFLWKACGAPEPVTTVNPFVDVPEGKWYYKPVLWAVEKGITGGMDATHFGVGKPCTREQAMTFLWKACGAPDPTTDDNPFLDVPAAKYYYKAVLWAVENGITSGVDQSHFGVGKSCTRGQIVTFLYKARDVLES